MQGFSKDFQYKILSMDFEERSDDPVKENSFNHFQSDYQSGFLTFLYIRLVETSTKISAK